MPPSSRALLRALHPLLPAAPRQISSFFAALEPNHPNAAKTRGVAFSTFFSCGGYDIIKNPLNFNVPYKICALAKASTDNYF